MVTTTITRLVLRVESTLKKTNHLPTKRLVSCVQQLPQDLELAKPCEITPFRSSTFDPRRYPQVLRGDIGGLSKFGSDNKPMYTGVPHITQLYPACYPVALSLSQSLLLHEHPRNGLLKVQSTLRRTHISTSQLLCFAFAFRSRQARQPQQIPRPTGPSRHGELVPES